MSPFKGTLMYKQKKITQSAHPAPITRSLWGQPVRDTFLALCDWTVPHGTEESYYAAVLQEYEFQASVGCHYLVVGNANAGSMFTAHMDTASRGIPAKIVVVDPNAKILKTDGTTILGADDRAGITVLLKMIEAQIPGLYCLFVGEECGGVGSRALSTSGKFPEDFAPKSCTSFDRRGVDSVITHQNVEQCASVKFAVALSAALNAVEPSFDFFPDDTGIYTDSAEFVDDIPECTNISVGYQKEHTVDEEQDIDFLERLCIAAVCVDWTSLPIERDHTVPALNNWYNGYRFELDELDRLGGRNDAPFDLIGNPTLIDWLEAGKEITDWVLAYPFAAADLLEEIAYINTQLIVNTYERRGNYEIYYS
jgi:hypothetical protein